MNNQIVNESVMLKEIFQQPELIRKTLALNLPKIKQIAEDIRGLNPKMINFAARGSSEHACLFAKYLFEIFGGIPSMISSPSVITAYHAPLNLENTVTIGVSQNGGALDVIEVLKRTKACGGMTVSITNTPGSLMEKEAQYHLGCEAGPEICITATKSYMTQMTLVTALAAYVTRNEYLLSCIVQLDQAVAAALDLEKDIVSMVEHYRFIDGMFLIARGYSHGIVAEAELKIQETSYIKATAYTSTDYTHGPFSLTRFDQPYLFVAVDQATNASVMQLYSRVAAKKACCLVITNNKEIAAQFPRSILLPEWCEGVLGSYAAAAVTQIFASYLSVSLGHNPDAPEGVSKQTITL